MKKIRKHILPLCLAVILVISSFSSALPAAFAATTYYPACDSSYESIVNALESVGETDTSLSNRKQIAALNGISDYTGTAEQNLTLLNLLKEGQLIKSTSSTSSSSTEGVTYRGTPSASYKSGKYYNYLTSIPLTGDKRTDTIAIALSQMGYQESDSSSNLSGETGGSSNYTEFMRFVYTNGNYYWCAAFCSWALYQSRASNHNGSTYWYRNHSGSTGYHWNEISCYYWVEGLKQSGLFKDSNYYGGTYTPLTGDLIFFYTTSTTRPSHVGLVVYTDDTYVYTIEGNTSSGSGVESNGGGTYFKKYSLGSSKIVGYGALDYDSDSDGKDIDYSGANPTAGLYMTAAFKYLYADASCTTKATYSNGTVVSIPGYTMVEVTGVSADGSALACTYGGVTGYLSNNSTDRAIQLTDSTISDSTSDSSSTDTTDDAVHKLQGVGTSGTKETHLGVDLSYYQVDGNNLAYEMIDFAALKDAGCEFAILRAGDSNRDGYIDPAFIQLYKNARAAGMPLGVYYFSRATTYDGAAAEAEWLIGIMEENNMYFEYPVYFDVETTDQSSLSATATDELCLGWCETMEKAGYFPGIYSNTSCAFDVLSSNVTDYYDLWIASVGSNSASGTQYDHDTKDYFSSGYGMWQYSWYNLDSSGNYVYDKGVYTSTAQTTPVTELDLNVCYKDYPAIMTAYGYNNCASDTTDNTVVEQTPEAGYTTSSNGSVHAMSKFHDDGLRLLDGARSNTDTKSTAYAAWNASEVEILVDLGAAEAVNTYSVYAAYDFWGVQAPADLTVWYSTYGTTYTELAIDPVVTQIDNGLVSLTVTSDIVGAQYIKFVVQGTGAFIWLDEVEVSLLRELPDGTVTYYPICDSSCESITAGLTAVGETDTSFAHRTEIATLNGMLNYSGTETQNIALLAMLKAGKLIKPATTDSGSTDSGSTDSGSTDSGSTDSGSTDSGSTDTAVINSAAYYPACDSSCETLIAGLTAVGETDTSYAFRAQIAAANGITDYTGTAEQNTAMLELLKAGKLLKVVTYYPACDASCATLIAALSDVGETDTSYTHRAELAALNGITDYTGTAEQNTAMLELLKAGKLIKSSASTSSDTSSSTDSSTDATTDTSTETPTVEYYNTYTNLASIANTSSCTVMQGMAVGSTYMYTVKIKSDETRAVLFKTNKNTGETTQLTDADTESSYLTYLGHANDMDVCSLNSKSNLFIATMQDGNSLVRLQVSGSTVTKMGSYTTQLDGADYYVSGVAILSKTSTHVNLLCKRGTTFYTCSVPINESSGTVALTKAFTIDVSNLYINGAALDASSWTHQGFGYDANKIYVPLWNSTSRNQSIVVVYDISNASGTLTADPYLSFRITSSKYSLFEIESCGICSSDGMLYFNTNRTATDGTGADGIHAFKVFVQE